MLMHALTILLDATPMAFDAGGAVNDSLGKMGGFIAAVVPIGLGIWAVLFGIGLAKKAAKKTTSG